MPLFFRKSVKLGPLRLNFSKSGVGVSGGVKGARVSVGPRGTHVSAGRHGVYYRKRIGGGKRGATTSRDRSGMTGCVALALVAVLAYFAWSIASVLFSGAH